MCIASNMFDSIKKLSAERQAQQKPAELSAQQVPLGTGLAQGAKLSIMDRRAQIRRAVEGQ